MDNMGAGGGGMNGGAVFGSPEAGGLAMPPNSGEDTSWTKPEGFDGNSGEVYASNAESAPELSESKEAATGEKMGEKQSSAMPMNNQAAVKIDQNTDEIAEAEAQADLEGVSIRRDSEVLPKAYMQAVTKIINRNRRDPHRLVTELDVARWDMMSKAFNRNLGDGLNGRGGE